MAGERLLPAERQAGRAKMGQIGRSNDLEALEASDRADDGLISKVRRAIFTGVARARDMDQSSS